MGGATTWKRPATRRDSPLRTPAACRGRWAAPAGSGGISAGYRGVSRRPASAQHRRHVQHARSLKGRDAGGDGSPPANSGLLLLPFASPSRSEWRRNIREPADLFLETSDHTDPAGPPALPARGPGGETDSVIHSRPLRRNVSEENRLTPMFSGCFRTRLMFLSATSPRF